MSNFNAVEVKDRIVTWIREWFKQNGKGCNAVIGISGGADSTLAFLITMRVCNILGLSKDHVIAVTMPGFGTSGRTYHNSKTLIQSYGADFREISIKDACIQHFKDINHKADLYLSLIHI